MPHRTLSSIVVLISIVFSAALLPLNIVSVNTAGDINRIDSYVNTAMQRHNIPGLALAITQGDQITFSKGYGKAGGGRIVTPDTPFYIGSQSKSFTALSIMQLVEQGKLELNTSVQTYLPWFQVADPQASQLITIRQLLQHTSGLSEEGYVADFPPDTDLETMVRDLSRANITAPVGSKMQYFNQGYSTLGLIIETVTGQSYGEYIYEHIFAPLKMRNSFTDSELANTADLSQGYSQIFMLAVPLKQIVYQSDLPAGYIISTANDMARFLMTLGNGGELDGVRILTPENVQLIFTPNYAINSTYGFGWYISKYYGETQITHGGDTERFHTSVLLLPERDLSLVILINENHLLKDFNEYNALLWDVAAILTNHPMPKEGLSSTIFGWGFFVLWLIILASAVRKFENFSKWRSKMLTWNKWYKSFDIAKHMLWIVLTIVIVIIIVPNFLGRSFSMRWFSGFLPDIAIIVSTLVLVDVLQIVLKLWIIIRQKKVPMVIPNSKFWIGSSI
ncbi:MAG: beta-lactamase family protein [Anaerolineaceae bacterium]|nr:beta-lactamase family protein [Anaerolineaceae bacterium]